MLWVCLHPSPRTVLPRLPSLQAGWPPAPSCGPLMRPPAPLLAARRAFWPPYMRARAPRTCTRRSEWAHTQNTQTENLQTRKTPLGANWQVGGSRYGTRRPGVLRVRYRVCPRPSAEYRTIEVVFKPWSGCYHSQHDHISPPQTRSGREVGPATRFARSPESSCSTLARSAASKCLSSSSLALRRARQSSSVRWEPASS